MQILGTMLEDPYVKEGSLSDGNINTEGIGLLPLKTRFLKEKKTTRIKSESIWPCSSEINGFEIHNGITELDESQKNLKPKPIFKEINLGWYIENRNGGTIAGTYIHGIFENDIWRESYINLIRKNKNLPKLVKRSRPYKIKRESIINNLANEFEKHFNITSLLN